MAVLPMKKIDIYGLNRNRKHILEFLQRQSCVEVSEGSVDENENVFFKADVNTSKSTFENSKKSLETSISILDQMVKPESSALSMFEGRKALSVKDYEKIEENSQDIIKLSYKIVSLNKKISDLKADIIRNEASISALVPWEVLDISMRVKKTESSRVFIGTMPGEYSYESLTSLIAKESPNLGSFDLEIISANTQQTCIFTVCHKSVADDFESTLRANGFSYPAAPSKTSPSERIDILNTRISTANSEIESMKNEIISYKDRRPDLLGCYDYLCARLEKYEVLGQVMQSKKVFCINGYITKEDSLDLKAKLEDKFDCFIELSDPLKNENVPVKLKNGGFAAPVENVVESYSLPGKGEIDPSGIMAIFYYFLFGLMLSDLAYGLIMAIGCGVVLTKFKTMEEGLKNSVKMFMYCGISTAFWGLMFGSFFGDVIEVVGATFFNATWSTPTVWFKPINEPMTLLMFSLLLGIIHLFTGLGMKFYLLCKQGQIKDAIYDVVFWYFLVGGGVLYFMSMEMFKDISGLGFTLDPMIGNVAAVFAGIGALGIIFTAGRTSKSPAIRIMKGVYGLYGATSYISDILSYSRLLALGLATGVIASVFNQMGAMGGGGVVGAIVFIIVFLLGHSLNIGLNVLGAYVHSNRLEFVEFFGKFYEGGGKKFNPFSAKTKYFKIMEE